MTEFLRRALTDLAGSDATQLEVPIILGASATAAVAGSFILCPFEAVRIRSVAQSGQRKSIFEVFEAMVKVSTSVPSYVALSVVCDPDPHRFILHTQDEGVGSLFTAVPAFILKEIPFNTAKVKMEWLMITICCFLASKNVPVAYIFACFIKFTVFDLSTAAMYRTFPVAAEDLKLSLLVSLAGGILGGITAAVVSNPADATITEMKKAKSDIGPVEAFQILLEDGGPPRLLTGLGLRMVFYSLIVSLQFLVYDAVRFALGIGADDLKLYLDVLGGALGETGGSV